jgi:hypothetical protein
MVETPSSGRLRPDSLAGTVLLTALAAICLVSHVTLIGRRGP